MRITLAVAVACLTFGGLAAAGDATAAVRKSTDIPAQGLGPALTKLAKEFDFQVLYRTEIVSDLKSPGAMGALTSDEALDKVLTGTGLTYKYLDDRTVTIIPVSTGGSGQSAPANASGSLTDASASKEGGKKTSQDFRVAQVDQGKASTDASVTNRPDQTSQQNSAGLTEIIVTAERHEENLSKVPISITAFTQKTMDDLHIQSFSDLATIVPGLVAPQPTPGIQGQTDVAIRGIFSGGNAPTTAIYIDETPIQIREFTAAGPSGSPHPDLFDLDRVEVLRGPQGTLFGSSAMGGAIRYITPQPNLDTSSGYSKAEVAYTDRGAPSYAVGLAYGAPIVQGEAGFRVSGWFHSDGGFIDTEDPYTGEIIKRNANSADAYVLRPAFTVVPTEGLTITPAVFIQHQHSDAPAEYWLTLLPHTESGAHATGALLPQPLTDDLTVPSLAIKYRAYGLSLQSDTSYVDRFYQDYDDFTHGDEALLDGGQPFIPGVPPTFGVQFKQRGGTKAFQQEFRLTSDTTDSHFHWVAGAYYRHAQETLSQIIPGDLGPITEAAYGLTSLQAFLGVPDYNYYGQVLNSYTWFRAVDEQTALFGEVAYDITAQIKATAGVRVEDSAVVQQHEVVAGPINGVAYNSAFLPDQIEHPVTPRFGLQYQYTDQDMVYASASKGYRAGGGNSATSLGNSLCTRSLQALGLSSVPSTFNSDSLWSYEIGSKNSLFDGRLAIQASAYLIDWKNIQTEVTLPTCGEVFTTNRGKAVSKGFDLQIAAIPVANLKLSVNVGYTDAYYPDAAYGAPPSNGGPPPLLNGTGDKLTNVLPWTASTHAEYSHDIGALWTEARSYIRVDYRWLDAAPRSNPLTANYDPLLDSNTGVAPNQAYSILNLRIGVLHQGLDISAFINNLTRSNPRLAYTQDFSPTSPLFLATALQPLTAGVTALYRF
jgi:iron complex outermembrane receptor protein